MHEQSPRGAVVPRSTLVVPATRLDWLEKALLASPDEVLIDLEDSVATSEKLPALHCLVELLGTFRAPEGVRLGVRTNAPHSAWLLDELTALLGLAEGSLHFLVLPKIESVAELHWIDGHLEHTARRLGRDPGADSGIRLGVLIESALALEDMRQIVEASRRIDQVILGQGDLAASLQMPGTTIGGNDPSGNTWLPVRSRFLVAARALGVRAVDGPFGDFHDPTGLHLAASQACALGFDGKWAIHPAQVEHIDAAFTPSADDVEKARSLLAMLDRGTIDGQGAVAHEGTMVDEAAARMARRTLARAGGGM